MPTASSPTMENNEVKSQSKKNKSKVETKSLDSQDPVSLSVPVTAPAPIMEKPVLAEDVTKVKSVSKLQLGMSVTPVTVFNDKNEKKLRPKQPTKQGDKLGDKLGDKTADKVVENKTSASEPVQDLATSRSKSGSKPAAVVKPNRMHTNKVSSFTQAGIGIGPAKVRKILIKSAFNPDEYKAKAVILKASKETPQTDEAGVVTMLPQVPINKLPKETLEVVKNAELLYHQSLLKEYTSEFMKNLSDADRVRFNELKAKHSGDNVYTAFNENFFNDFAVWVEKHDSYAIGKRIKESKDEKNGSSMVGEQHNVYTQWSRAIALINKNCLRLSVNVRYILAAFLDNLVVQYARNGIINCVTEGNGNMQLRHALAGGSEFSNRVPLNPYVSTLEVYRDAVQWINECDQIDRKNNEIKTNNKRDNTNKKLLTKPAFPLQHYDESFDSCVSDICTGVKMELAGLRETNSEKQKYASVKISGTFKQFCSAVIYDTILRYGHALKAVIACNEVKTVNEKILYMLIQTMCSLNGISYEFIKCDLNMRLNKYSAWCEQKRKERQLKKSQRTVAEHGTHATPSEVDETEELDVDELDDTEADDVDEAEVDETTN